MPRSAVMMSIAAGLFSLSAAFAADTPITYESLLREMVDRDRIARLPAPAYTCRQFSSYDRASTSPDKPDTWFANADAKQFLRTEENGGRKEWVLMDADGPGAVVRFWSANPRDEITVRFYFDGASEAALAVPLADLLGGTWRVGAPLSAIRARGWNLYLPIPYAKHCKVTVDNDDIYYQINYRTYPPGTDVETFSMAAFEKGRAALRDVTLQLSLAGRDAQPPQRDARRLGGALPPGQSAPLVLPPGPRAVRELSVSLFGGDRAAAYRGVILKIEFDGEETVWCPVGDFFGSGVGVNPYRSWWTSVEQDGAMTCRWPMPYEKAAKITLENRSTENVTYAVHTTLGDWSWDERSMHLHATFRHESGLPTEPKRDWNFVEITGQGVYVGDGLALLNPTTVWWGEGDEKIYVDGEAFPSHFGTGTEDYYGYAWGDWHYFEAPFHAQPRVDGPIVLGHTTLVRSRSLDAIPFERSLKFDMEIWHWRSVKMAYAASTMYYARPGARDNRRDDRKPEAAYVDALQPVFAIAGAVEAESMEVVSMPRGIDWKLEGNWWGAQWSGDAQIWFGCTKVGDAIELRCPKPLSGPQKATLYATRYPDYGMIRVSIDGKPVGPSEIDLHNPEKGVKATGPIELGVIQPGAGAPLIRIEVVGSNADAPKPGTYVGLDCVVFEPAGKAN